MAVGGVDQGDVGGPAVAVAEPAAVRLRSAAHQRGELGHDRRLDHVDHVRRLNGVGGDTSSATRCGTPRRWSRGSPRTRRPGSLARRRCTREHRLSEQRPSSEGSRRPVAPRVERRDQERAEHGLRLCAQRRPRVGGLPSAPSSRAPGSPPAYFAGRRGSRSRRRPCRSGPAPRSAHRSRRPRRSVRGWRGLVDVHRRGDPAVVALGLLPHLPARVGTGDQVVAARAPSRRGSSQRPTPPRSCGA